MKRKNLNNIFLYFLSFYSTALILFIAFYLNGIYPGSEKSILIYDMGAQYVSFFSYFYHIGEGYNSIFFQSLSALGGGYFGTWAYYTASPLSLLVLLFDPSDLQDAIYYLTLIKISLSAVSFSVYIKHGRFKRFGLIPALAVSISYSLMSYNIIYSMNLMWMDGVIILPLAVLGFEWMMEDKSRFLFCLFLSLSIIFNYYTAFMIIIFVFVYFIYYSYSSFHNFKRILKGFLKVFISVIISILFSSFIWLPVFFDLTHGRLKVDSSVGDLFIRNPLSVIRALFPWAYGGFSYNDIPPIYNGLLITLFVFLFFISNKVSKYRKVAGLTVFVFFVLSFCICPLDKLWHGMQMPVSHPARYSFVFSFFLIMLCCEVILVFIKDHINYIFHIISACLLFVVIADLGLNTYHIISCVDKDSVTCGYLKTVRYDHYFNVYKELDQYLSDPDIRIVSDQDCSSDDGLAFGVPSLDYFSSSYYSNLSDFYKKSGLNTERHNFEDLGLNPLSASLFGVDYYVPFLSEFSEDEYRYDLHDHFIPVNLDNNLKLYKNPYSIPFLTPINDPVKEFDFNAFDNLNEFCRDVTGVGNVFSICDETLCFDGFTEDGSLHKKIFKVSPLSGKHLYFYVSPADYEFDNGICYDYLFINDSLIASYENSGYRYIVDLGVSDGTELQFTFISASDNSDIWFYSFDDIVYNDAMKKIKDKTSSETVFDRSGIDCDIQMEENSDVLILLPYEDGYNICVDGKPVSYGSYRDALLKIHLPEGDHHVALTYCPDGLIAGLFVTMISFVTLAFYTFRKIYKRKCYKNEKSL